MKVFKLLGVALCFMLISSSMVFAQEAKLKFAHVDLAKLFDEYDKTKAYDKVLEADNTKFQEERNKKIDSIKELQGKMDVLKDAEKAKVEKDIETLKNEILEFDRTKRTDLTKARDEKVREILLEIEKLVSAYAQKEGITYVMNDRVLVYGDKTLNITEPILKTLNDNYKAQGGKK
jgi:outer membrane protein